MATHKMGCFIYASPFATHKMGACCRRIRYYILILLIWRVLVLLTTAPSVIEMTSIVYQILETVFVVSKSVIKNGVFPFKYLFFPLPHSQIDHILLQFNTMGSFWGISMSSDDYISTKLWYLSIFVIIEYLIKTAQIMVVGPTRPGTDC